MIVMTENGVEVAFRGAVRLAELAPELVDRIFEKLLPDRRAEIDDRTDRPEIIAGDVRPRDQKLDRRRHQRDDRWPVPPQRSDQYFWIESGQDRYRRAVIERRDRNPAAAQMEVRHRHQQDVVVVSGKRRLQRAAEKRILERLMPRCNALRQPGRAGGVG